jgi:hypothetical protein
MHRVSQLHARQDPLIRTKLIRTRSFSETFFNRSLKSRATAMSKQEKLSPVPSEKPGAKPTLPISIGKKASDMEARAESGVAVTMVIGGVVSVILALMIWRQFPLSGIWLVGTMVGISLFVNGLSTVAVGTAARRASRPVISGEVSGR